MDLGKFIRLRGVPLSKTKKSPKVGLILFLSISISLAFGSKVSHAQTIPESWQSPINLSNSGGTQNPLLLKGNSGELHAIWEDDYAKFVNRNFTDAWGQNFSLDLPFNGQRYQIVADNTGWFYVFWINGENNNLQYSGVAERNFGQSGSWLSAVTLATSVVSFDVDIDVNNQTHVIFTRALDTNDAPAGIYYTRTFGGVSGWTDARLIYQSKYFRSMLPPEGEANIGNLIADEAANVSVNTADLDGNISIYLGWENPALKRLFFDKSSDNGQTWQQPQEVITPSQDVIQVTPISLETAFLPGTILQFWKMSEPGGNCSLYYRTSANNGQDWTSQQSLDSTFGRCPDSLNWDYLNSEVILFIAQNQNTVFLVAWDGKNWSLPQAQPEINQFLNPVTFDIIEFDTISPAVYDDTLYIAGKDKSSSNDIFFTQKKLTDVTGWFSGSSGWSPIQTTEIGQGPLLALNAVGSANNQFNFLLTTNNYEKVNRSNLLALPLSASGSPSLATISDNLEGKADQLASAVGYGGARTAVLWRGGELGQIYSKWVFQDQFSNPVGWSIEKQLETTVTGQFPAITAKNHQDLYAIFSNSYSGQRGMLLVSSNDGGEKWSVPKLVSDFATIENCPFFNQSSIAADNGSNLYVLFQCSTFPGGTGAISLYAIQSSNSGDTWSTPTLVSDQPVTWNSVLFDGNETIHRIWKIEDSKTTIWHSYSKDQGLSWSSPSNVAIIEEQVGPSSAVTDTDGQLHFLQAAYLSNGLPTVTYFRWEGNKWANFQTINLESAGYGDITQLAAGIDLNGNLQAGIALNMHTNSANTSVLITASYPLTNENLAETGAQGENVQPTALASAVTTDTAATAPAATVAVASTEPPPLNTQPTRSTPMFLSVGAGVLVSLGFIALILFKTRKNNNGNS
jgi:hypothetical protein